MRSTTTRNWVRQTEQPNWKKADKYELIGCRLTQANIFLSYSKLFSKMKWNESQSRRKRLQSKILAESCPVQRLHESAWKSPANAIGHGHELPFEFPFYCTRKEVAKSDGKMLPTNNVLNVQTTARQPNIKYFANEWKKYSDHELQSSAENIAVVHANVIATKRHRKKVSAEMVFTRFAMDSHQRDIHWSAKLSVKWKGAKKFHWKSVDVIVKTAIKCVCARAQIHRTCTPRIGRPQQCFDVDGVTCIRKSRSASARATE